MFRNTIMQVATPDAMRGRLQGVFIVVVAGGPRLGDFLAGSMAAAFGLRVALVAGGLACVVAVVALSRLLPELTAYVGRTRVRRTNRDRDRDRAGRRGQLSPGAHRRRG